MDKKSHPPSRRQLVEDGAPGVGLLQAADPCRSYIRVLHRDGQERRQIVQPVQRAVADQRAVEADLLQAGRKLRPGTAPAFPLLCACTDEAAAPGVSSAASYALGQERRMR